MNQKQQSRRRIWKWVGLGLIVLVVLGFVGFRTGLIGGGEEGEGVETDVVALRQLTQVVTASGKIQPEIEVKISPDVSGEIIGLPVQEGDFVQRGDLLARIRPDFYSAQVEQAQAGVLQAQANRSQRRANMLNAEATLRRQKELRERDAISDSEFEMTETQYEVEKSAFEAAEYAVQSAEARLREAKEQLSKTNIYAPMTGTVSQLNVELGERVVGTSQFAGTEMMRVAQLDQMELEVEVNENDVVNVAIGDSSSVEIDAYPERTFRGVVTEIANSARISHAGSQEQVTNFPVKIRLLFGESDGEAEDASEADNLLQQEIPTSADAPALLRPGMSGNVDIFTHTIAAALAVPIQAVTVRDFSVVSPEDTVENDEEGPEEDQDQEQKRDPSKEDLRKVVFVFDGGKAEMREVETGIADNTHVEITTGLREGDEVISGPYRMVSRELEPGMEVRPE